MKKLMLGNEAFARGLFEAGCRFASSYPGTPSTEITEYLAKYDEVYAEWAPNEKVAVEAALGASIAGARSFAAMKHVGLNVAADPLYTASYSGVNGGLVLAVADDPGMHSSQNEQDSRHHAIAAKVPMLEPSDSQECKSFAMLAFRLSETYDTPVIVRTSTRVAHSQSVVEELPRKEQELREYVKESSKYVMMPAYARGRHVVVENRMKKLVAYAEIADINRIEQNGSRIGVITCGIAYQYAKEALGDSVNYLKLGMTNPLPSQLFLDFAAHCDTIYVIEELDGILEAHCKALGIACKGKELFGNIGELNHAIIADVINGVNAVTKPFPQKLPMRPPVMCAGCPHRGLFYLLAKHHITVSGDIGCYTLGAAAPLNSMDWTICMGASVSALHGFNKMRGEAAEQKSVAVIGDSTFIHSGITGLVNVSYNASHTTVIILDNSITGMTGHQDNPTTGKNLKGDPATKVCLEDLCHAVGISRVRVADPYHLEEMEQAILEELAVAEPSVIISRRPCALLKSVKHPAALVVDQAACKGCKRCLRLGCPAISLQNNRATIDHTQCVGCGICQTLCKCGAIRTAE